MTAKELTEKLQAGNQDSEIYIFHSKDINNDHFDYLFGSIFDEDDPEVAGKLPLKKGNKRVIIYFETTEECGY
jgi:hypothetical protein